LPKCGPNTKESLAALPESTTSPEVGTIMVAVGNSIGAFTEIAGKTVTITNWNADDAGGGTPIRPSPFRS